MAITVHSEAHATVLVKTLRVTAPPDTLVLALSPRKQLSDKVDAFSFPELIERRDQPLKASTVHRQYGVSPEGQQIPLRSSDIQLTVTVRDGATPLKSNLRLTIVRTAVIASWYCSNIALLLTNRYLLSSKFQQPVFLTLCHMVASSLVPLLAMATRSGPRPLPLSRSQLGRLAILSTVFCTSVVLGNVALRFLHVSFFQAISATTPAFVAALALVMMRQQETRGVYLALIPVMAGLVVATGAEPSFNVVGFAATIIATSLRALKTVLQATLLKRIEPMIMLRYMALMSTCLMLIATVVLEPHVLSMLPAWRGPQADQQFYYWLALNCCFAFTSNLSNFLVTKYTSPLTLQVLGNALGVFGTGFSIMVFRNPVTAASMCGYSITMAGVGLFVFEKRRGGASSKGSLSKGTPIVDVEKPLLVTGSAK